MSDIEFDRCDRELLKNCVAVFDAETKKLTRKPNANAEITMTIDDKRLELNMTKLCNTDDTSYFEEVFKSL